MLEFLASADPMSLPLWALLLFAAGMYPVGMFLPCSSCCGCASCLTGRLPDTITVTLSDFPESVQYQGPDLITVVISSACFGEGATARVTAPGGNPATDAGPIAAVEVTNGGLFPYAKLGRVEPTLTISGGSGTGATFTPTLTSDADECAGLPFWTISSVAVEGGTGYLDGEQLLVAAAEDTSVVVESNDIIIVHTTRTEPELTAEAAEGANAVFDITTAKNDGTPDTWRVDSVAVTNGGQGYVDGSPLTFSGGPGLRFDEAASAYIRTERDAPTLAANVVSLGVDAVLTVVLGSGTSVFDDRPYWYVDDLTIDDGGTGYSENDPIIIEVTDGTASIWSNFSAHVASVDEDGAITAITIDDGGEYYKDTGVIESVEVTFGGQYFDDDGVPVSVEVVSGGAFYTEDPDEDPYVADISVTIEQQEPSNGEGAVLSAVVDLDTSSETFGQIIGITIDDGGDGYLAWRWLDRKLCCDFYNGTHVLKKGTSAGNLANAPLSNPGLCGYAKEFCGNSARLGGWSRLNVAYNGPSSYPTVTLLSEFISGSDSPNASSHCNVTLTGTSYITDCDDFSFEATGTIGGVEVTATVEPGGDYEPHDTSKSCFVCCQGADSMEQEVSISFSGADAYYQQYDGDYVMTFDGVTHYIGDDPYASFAKWSCSIPDIVEPGSITTGELESFRVFLRLCSRNTQTEFVELNEYPEGDCNDCSKKCLTDMGIGIWTPLAGAGPGDFVNYTSHRYGELLNPGDPWDQSVEWLDCGELCQENPQCGPAPGSYPVRQHVCYGGGFGCLNFPIGTVTIE